MSSKKPIVVICVTPIPGHIAPIRAVAKGLVSRGYEVTVVVSPVFRKTFEDAGASYVPLQGAANFDSPENLKKREFVLSRKWDRQLGLWTLKEVFFKAIPDQHAAIQEALKSVNSTSRPVVLVTEAWFYGSLPSMLGAGPLRPTAYVGIGVTPLFLPSVDHPPFGMASMCPIPDGLPESREKNIAMQKMARESARDAEEMFLKYVVDLGGTKTDLSYADAVVRLQDRFIQMCLPSLEYDRSDAPSTLVFSGGLPPGHREPATSHPPWWDEYVTNASRKHIIGVTQGTIRLDYEELIIPTMRALQSHPDILIIAVLGQKDAVLPPGTVVPANARVIDYLPFDELLPYCAIFVVNGGYGGVQHAISNGIPLVIAGGSAEKPETAARAERAGVAVNLRTGTPSDEALKGAIEEVLGNPRYKKKAMEMKEEIERRDVIGFIAGVVEEVVKEKAERGESMK